MHIINSIGSALDKATAEAMLDNMLSSGIMDEQTARLIASAMGERVYIGLPQQYRDPLRASIFKTMLLTLLDT